MSRPRSWLATLAALSIAATALVGGSGAAAASANPAGSGASVAAATRASDDAPLRREISNEKPLFLVTYYYSDSTGGDSLEQLWSTIPEDLQENAVVLLIAERSLRNVPEVRDWITQTADDAQAASIPFAVQAVNGETKVSQQIPVTFFEQLAESHSMMHGLNSAELYNSETWYGSEEGNHSEYVRELVEVSAATGMHMMWTDTNIWGNTGTIARWLATNEGLYDAFRDNPENIVMMNKESFGDHDTDALNLGLWLAGAIGNWGTSSDWWHWGLNGYGQLGGGGGQQWKDIMQYPDAMTVQSMLRVASQGGTAYKAEAQWFTMAVRGERTATFEYGIIPLLRDIKADLVQVPTREQMLEQNKVVFTDSDAWHESQFSYDERSNIFPKTGRYGIVPVLPATASEGELANFENVLTTPKDQAYFDALYPEQTITSNTFMSHTDRTWYWMNYSENQEYTGTTTFDPALSGAGVIGIEAGNHTFATFTERENAVDVIVNNYRVNKSDVRAEAIYGREPGQDFSKDETYRYISEYLTVALDENGAPVVDADGNVTTAAGRTLNDRSDRDVRSTTFRVEGTWKGGEPEVVFADPATATRPYSVQKQWDAERQTLLVTLTHNGPVSFSIHTDAPATSSTSTTFEAEGPEATRGSKTRVAADGNASGGEVVVGKGNGKKKENSVEWTDVRVGEAGAATLRLDATAKHGGTFAVSVNGGAEQLVGFTRARDQLVSSSIRIELKEGANMVRVAGLASSGPALDAVTLIRSEELPATAAELSISADSVVQGASVTATVTGLEPGATVTASLRPGDVAVAGIGTARLDGSLTFTVPVDYAVAAGEYELVVRLGDSELREALTVEQAPFIVRTYEAESAENTLQGNARVGTLAGASGGKFVGELGPGPEHTVTVNGVTAEAAGTVTLRIAAISGENRSFGLSVNGAAPITVAVPGLSWTQPQIVEVEVQLTEGANTLRFGSSSSGYAPSVDAVTVLEPKG